MEGVPALRDLIEPSDYMATSRVQKRRDSLPIQVAQFWLIKCRSLNFLQDTTTTFVFFIRTVLFYKTRFPVQHQENGDQSPRYEDQEPPITTETNFTPNLEIMPVDGRSNGESHGDDTRSERGVITYPIHAERFGKIVNQESSQLRRSVRVVTAATPRRDSVIATINYLEE
ncbi:hypothetical protein PS6_011465 [Mucor atramentarius]